MYCVHYKIKWHNVISIHIVNKALVLPFYRKMMIHFLQFLVPFDNPREKWNQTQEDINY